MSRKEIVPVYTTLRGERVKIGSATINSDGTITISTHPSQGQRFVRDTRSGEVEGFSFAPIVPEGREVEAAVIQHIAMSADDPSAVCNGEPVKRVNPPPGTKIRLCDICYHKSIRMSTPE